MHKNTVKGALTVNLWYNLYMTDVADGKTKELILVQENIFIKFLNGP